MLTLLKDFKIVSIDNDDYKKTKLEKFKNYLFMYKKHKIELSVSFSVLGFTKKDNIAILNFGYSVNVLEWVQEKNDYEDQLLNLIPDSSRTKEYIDSKEARELIVRFVEKSVDEYLKKVSPAIVIRGALTEEQINLQRYKRLDTFFLKYGYQKKIFTVSENKSLYSIAATKYSGAKYIWAYSKNPSYLDQLNDVMRFY